MSDSLAPVETPTPLQADRPLSDLQSAEATAQERHPLPAETLSRGLPAEEAEPAVKPQAPAATELPVHEEPRGTGSAPKEAEDRSVPKTNMGDVLADDYAYQRPKRGEIRQGRIIAIRGDSIVVDLGLKREGVIPAEDLQRVGADVVASLSVGDEIPVYILRPEDDKEGILVSLHRARQEQDWINAQRLHDTGEIWETKVKGCNRGGLIVNYGKIRGFIPASHLTGVSRRMDPATLQARLAEMVGQTLPLKVIEVDRQNRRLIFSERTARREWRSQQREKLIEELKEGDHVRGVVSNICDFGVFIDVGGTDGLVHISELSWRRTAHPSELLKVGDEVEAYVLRVDKERKRIGLSLRLMEPDPWEQAEEKYHVGQVVSGMITKVTNFGAFAALDDGIEGLIHISELADPPPKRPEEVVSVGMTLPLCILKIDSKRRRMGLSLKHVPEEAKAKWEEEHGKAEAESRKETEPAPEAPVEAAVEQETKSAPELAEKAEPELPAAPGEETQPVIPETPAQ
jgi:small subunit ribosomal protein S1